MPSVTIRSSPILRGLSHIQIGENFFSRRGLWLEAITEYCGETFAPQIRIGANVCISSWSHIAAVNSVEIGSDVLIGSKVMIADHNHGFYGTQAHSSPRVPPAFRELSRGRVAIGNKVWIGDGVVVAPESEIGEGSIIGANAFVKGVIPAFTVAVGTPAKPIKRYDFDLEEWVKSES